MGSVTFLGVNCLVRLSELSVQCVRAVWAGAVPPRGRAVTLGKKGKQRFATVRSSPWADLHCALQPQFSFCFFQLEAGQPPVVSAQLPVPGYPV